MKYTTEFNVDDVVVFNGQTEEQRRWGGNDDANEFLIVGKEYIVESVVRHTWHTKLKLRNKNGRFNSVCFDLVGVI